MDLQFVHSCLYFCVLFSSQSWPQGLLHVFSGGLCYHAMQAASLLEVGSRSVLQTLSIYLGACAVGIHDVVCFVCVYLFMG